MSISTNQFRNGNHIDVDGTVFKIVEFQHVKPGKGGAFVRTKLRRASDGAVIDRTFRAGEKFRSVRTEVRRMQFLYRDGADAHFMDSESYEQRGAAVWALYQSDLLGRPLDETFPRDAHAFTRALAHATREQQPELDGLISRYAVGWSLDRIAPLERSILRVALLELLHPDA